jgi:hypothetical protein
LAWVNEAKGRRTNDVFFLRIRIANGQNFGHSADDIASERIIYFWARGQMVTLSRCTLTVSDYRLKEARCLVRMMRRRAWFDC